MQRSKQFSLLTCSHSLPGPWVSLQPHLSFLYYPAGLAIGTSSVPALPREIQFPECWKVWDPRGHLPWDSLLDLPTSNTTSKVSEFAIRLQRAAQSS